MAQIITFTIATADVTDVIAALCQAANVSATAANAKQAVIDSVAEVTQRYRTKVAQAALTPQLKPDIT